jgi:hypothetical protein
MMPSRDEPRAAARQALANYTTRTDIREPVKHLAAALLEHLQAQQECLTGRVDEGRKVVLWSVDPCNPQRLAFATIGAAINSAPEAASFAFTGTLAEYRALVPDAAAYLADAMNERAEYKDKDEYEDTFWGEYLYDRRQAGKPDPAEDYERTEDPEFLAALDVAWAALSCFGDRPMEEEDMIDEGDLEQLLENEVLSRPDGTCEINHLLSPDSVEAWFVEEETALDHMDLVSYLAAGREELLADIRAHGGIAINDAGTLSCFWGMVDGLEAVAKSMEDYEEVMRMYGVAVG